MSLPPLNPSKSAAGISVDPRTLERIVAPTKRSDGSVRKEIKIRPGYTPQEDVKPFRPIRVQDSTAGRGGPRVIPGWVPPEQPAVKKAAKPTASTAKAAKAGATSGAKGATPAKKAKKAEKVPAIVKDSWEEDEDVGTDQAKVGAAGEQTSSSKSAEQATSDIDQLTKDVERVDISES